MAKISMIRPSDGPRLLHNIDAAVGPGASNRRDDVLLVQYFLRESFKGVDAFKAEPFPGGPVVVDGRASPTMYAAILHFQKVTKKRGSNIATDGRVDPPVGEQLRGSISNTQYTMIFLNQAYKKARPVDWPRVSQATDCPTELRPLLREPEYI